MGEEKEKRSASSVPHFITEADEEGTLNRFERKTQISSFSSNDSLGRPHLHSPSLACRVLIN